MKLKGNFKQDFESFYLNTDQEIPKPYKDELLNDFYTMPSGMQWGVYQDFAETVGAYFGKGLAEGFWFFTESEVYFDEDTNYISIDNLFNSREEVLNYFQNLYNRRT